MTLALALAALIGTAPCSPATGDAHSLLVSAATATGLPSVASRVLHVKGFDVALCKGRTDAEAGEQGDPEEGRGEQADAHDAGLR